MTGLERRAEMESMKRLEVPFQLLHERLEALIGRPVWTHEFGMAWDALLNEAETWERNEDAPFDSLPNDKPVICILEVPHADHAA
jgi:hypothetical protein